MRFDVQSYVLPCMQPLEPIIQDAPPRRLQPGLRGLGTLKRDP